MEYNTQLDRLIIPEYGRNIQGMIEYCCTIKDRDERNTCAKAIIQVMGQLNPHLRDATDYVHKLWDHLFIISKFKLDVDSPYPKPSPETFQTKPAMMPYPKGRIRYKHYGKTIEEIILKARQMPKGESRAELTRQIANHLKKSYLNWNKDSITDDVILKNLEELSQSELRLANGVTLSSHQELRGGNSQGGSNNNSGKKFFHKNNQNNKYKSNNFKHKRKY
jgi:hypothetical protein